MKNVTGSKLPILKHCQFFARDDVSYHEDTERGAAATRGVSIHEAISDSDLSKVVFEDLGPTQRGVNYLNDLRLRGYEVETEVPFAFDATSSRARRLPGGQHRDYSSALQHEIPFTVDYVAYSARDVEVGDWKTGYGAHVDRTSGNWQVGIAAIAAAELFNAETVTGKIHYLDTDFTDIYRFSATELRFLASDIQRVIQTVDGSQPNPGDHCKYCPARLACPAVASAISSVAASPGVRWSLDRITLQNDALMAMHLPALKAAVDAVEKALKSRCKEGLPLPNGKIWKPIVQRRVSIDTEKVKAELGERYNEFTKVSEYETFRQVKP